MKAIVFDQYGEPGDVLKVRDVPVPEPGRNEVRVRMIASPINPSDLMTVRGRYVTRPQTPATPGYEGVGVVDKVGPGLLGRFVKGKRVVVINPTGGNWAEYAVIPAVNARPVSSQIDDDQVASFFVNPATVVALVRYVLEVPRGAWLLQSAAGSSLGRMIIRYAKARGVRTINVVRRAEAVGELKSFGGDVVLSTANGPLEDQVQEVTGGAMVRYAIDPAGGDTGTQVYRCLGPDGRMVVYGSLSNEPMELDPRRLITNRATVQGFWLGHWVRGLSIPKKLALFGEIAAQMKGGVLTTEVGARFPLEAVADAVREAEAVGRRGKVLLALAAR